MDAFTIWNDAGLLREATVSRHGHVLAYGGSAEAWRLAHRSVKRLARLAGRSVDEVRKALVEDYLADES